MGITLNGGYLMGSLGPESIWQDVEPYDEILPGFGSCQDEFLGILTLALEHGSTMDILMRLLEDLVAYEQRCALDPAGLQVGQTDFLLWSQTYYRFIALSSLGRG